MSEEYDPASWLEDAQGSNYVRDYPCTVRFLQDHPEKTENQWNRISYEFPVQLRIHETDRDGNTDFAKCKWTGTKILAVQSKRLLRELASMHPLQGKVVEIFREGEGQKTRYEVSEVVVP